MIFVNNTSQLQQNNLCYRENPYFQPVIIERDISLQGFLPKQLQNDYTIEIHLMSSDGDEFIADITTDFDILFGTSIYNQNYFNIRLKRFAPIFENIRCFLLRIIVKNAGFKVFDKITESYLRLQHTKQCYAVIDDFAMMIINKSGYIKINNQVFQFGQGIPEGGFEIEYQDGNYYVFVDCADVVQIGYCYQGEDIIINVPLTSTAFIDEDCNLPLVRLESSYNCKDNILEGYFGDPKILLNYANNNEELKHTNSSYIRGEVEIEPTEIKRQTTKNGKPQSVEYIQKFNLSGLELFPKWKMLEIEAVFSGRRIYVNGVEYIFRGGKIFSKSEMKGSCSFKLNSELENIPKSNDFNCLEDCTMYCNYFVIFAGEKDQNYYDENKTLIGGLYQDLLDYFINLPDTISVTDIDTSVLDCDVVAVIKIDSFGIVPSYFYYKLPINEYKIFSKYDDCALPTKLCEGLASCERPKNITSTITDYNPCPQTPSRITSTITDLTEFEDLQPVRIYHDWVVEDFILKKYNNTNQATLAFILSNPSITGMFDEIIMKLPINPVITQFYTEDLAEIQIDANGNIFAIGEMTAGKLTLTFKTFMI